MAWQRLSVVVSDTLAEPLADLLSELGALSVSVTEAGNEQPLFEPGPGETPLWTRAEVTGLFDAETDLGPIMIAASEQLTLPASDQWRTDTLQDQAWERAWMDDFHPRRLGERLWVCPSWQSPPDPDAVNVLMDPGLAFGSGTHPTTTLCLQWLDAHIRGGETVIDYGCGSGILGIAALKLGAAEAWCVDNDPQALTATLDNATHNGVAGQVHAVAPDAALPSRAPLLVANILATPLMELAPQLTRHVEPGGHIVLSGILASQRDQVADCYTPQFALDADGQLDDWVRISGRRGS